MKLKRWQWQFRLYVWYDITPVLQITNICTGCKLICNFILRQYFQVILSLILCSPASMGSIGAIFFALCLIHFCTLNIIHFVYIPPRLMFVPLDYTTLLTCGGPIPFLSIKLKKHHTFWGTVHGLTRQRKVLHIYVSRALANMKRKFKVFSWYHSMIQQCIRWTDV
jgi:hypothetical protein